LPHKNPDEHICQSCSFSLEKIEDSGTEADGTYSEDYCSSCFESGEFTEPEITIKELIERDFSTTAKTLSITLEEAKIYLESLLPTLKRWR
jgi:hypothetical protein